MLMLFHVFDSENLPLFFPSVFSFSFTRKKKGIWILKKKWKKHLPSKFRYHCIIFILYTRCLIFSEIKGKFHKNLGKQKIRKRNKKTVVLWLSWEDLERNFFLHHLPLQVEYNWWGLVVNSSSTWSERKKSAAWKHFSSIDVTAPVGLVLIPPTNYSASFKLNIQGIDC